MCVQHSVDPSVCLRQYETICSLIATKKVLLLLVNIIITVPGQRPMSNHSTSVTYSACYSPHKDGRHHKLTACLDRSALNPSFFARGVSPSPNKSMAEVVSTSRLQSLNTEALLAQVEKRMEEGALDLFACLRSLACSLACLLNKKRGLSLLT